MDDRNQSSNKVTGNTNNNYGSESTNLANSNRTSLVDPPVSNVSATLNNPNVNNAAISTSPTPTYPIVSPGAIPFSVGIPTDSFNPIVPLPPPLPPNNSSTNSHGPPQSGRSRDRSAREPKSNKNTF